MYVSLNLDSHSGMSTPDTYLKRHFTRLREEQYGLGRTSPWRSRSIGDGSFCAVIRCCDNATRGQVICIENVATRGQVICIENVACQATSFPNISDNLVTFSQYRNRQWIRNGYIAYFRGFSTITEPTLYQPSFSGASIASLSGGR